MDGGQYDNSVDYYKQLPQKRKIHTICEARVLSTQFAKHVFFRSVNSIEKKVFIKSQYSHILGETQICDRYSYLYLHFLKNASLLSIILFFPSSLHFTPSHVHYTSLGSNLVLRILR